VRVIVAGGGTGGHLFPGIAVATELREHHAAEIRFLGSEHGIEKRAVPHAGFEVDLFPVRGLRGKNPADMMRGVRDLLRSLRAAGRALRAFRPDLAIGVGGYSAFPGILAAAWQRVPIVLLEQNASVGLTNRLLARFAKSVCTSFETTRDALGARAVFTGNPIRFRAPDAPVPHPVEAPLQLLVFGGSAGARRLNEIVPQALALACERIVVCHQAGGSDSEEVRAAYAAAGIEAEVTPFIDDMAEAYARADLVVCRAGASTIAELTALGKPAILVPYPWATGDHQTDNARPLDRAGAAWLIADGALAADDLADRLDALAADRRALSAAGAAAKRLGRPDALDRVVEVCLAAARGAV
jgi:UDP-N-acetylglucosamine--N-acetylmuramyl-(pentapeptide) pyrophosphoryl-undecaprenol N-acetylglucosamine transferase